MDYSTLNNLIPPLIDYVVALHDYSPLPTGSNTCLSFTTGQVIRVLNRNDSGWWDGETVVDNLDSLAITASRGWFPSNYVTSIDSFPDMAVEVSIRSAPSSASITSCASVSSCTSRGGRISPHMSSSSPSIDPLQSSINSDNANLTLDFLSGLSLHAPVTPGDPLASTPNTSPLDLLEQAIDHLKLEIKLGHLASAQSATANVIAAVRNILNLFQCLNPNSPILKLHAPLARERKNILSVLGGLVEKVSKLDHEHSKRCQATTTAGQNIQPEDFHNEFNSILKYAAKILQHNRRFFRFTQRFGIPISAPTTELDCHSNITSNELAALNDLNAGSFTIPLSSFHYHFPPFNTPPSPNISLPAGASQSLPLGITPQTSLRSTTSSQSSTSARASTPISNYRLPLISGHYTTGEILEMLQQSHDGVISTVAMFLGHAHIHSRAAHPSSHAYLIDMTRDVLETVRKMLVLVESISKQELLRVNKTAAYEDLCEAREELYVVTTNLVTAARVATSGPPDHDAPGPEHALLTSATALLRGASECSSAASLCLDGEAPDGGSYAVVCDENSASEPTARAGSPSSAHPSPDSPVTDQLLKSPSPPASNSRSLHTISMLGRKVNSLQSVDSQRIQVPSSYLSEARSTRLLLDDSTASSCDLETSPAFHHSNGPILPPMSFPQLSPPCHSLVTLGSDPDPDKPITRSNSFSSAHSDASCDSTPPTSASVSAGHDRSGSKLTCPGQSVLSPDVLTAPGNSLIETSSSETWLNIRDSKPEEVSLNSDGSVIGGTLNALVERMTLHDTPIEAAFSHTFFLTFRIFTTPIELARALIVRFAIEAPPDFKASTSLEEQQNWRAQKIMPIRLRVYNVFKTWLELHWRPREDLEALEIISSWARTTMLLDLHIPCQRFLGLVNRRLEESKQPNLSPSQVSTDPSCRDFVTSVPSPPPILSKQLLSQLRSPTSTISMTDIDPTELARQITIIESKLYCAILPEEIVGQQFAKKVDGKDSKVSAMSGMTTRLTGWITECILMEEDPRKRSGIVKYCLKLGVRLLELQNYNGLMAIMSALNSSTINRLKRTWEILSTKSKTIFVTLNKAVSHHRNYAEYRAALRRAQNPCLPFLGVYLTDITFCYEGNPPHRASSLDPTLKLINFDRYQKMSKIITDLQRFQLPYNLIEVREIVNFIRHSLSSLQHKGSADSLYRRSLFIEPRDLSHTPSST